jgi:hypothetical protein
MVYLWVDSWVDRPRVRPSEWAVELFALAGGDDPPAHPISLTDDFGTAFAAPGLSVSYQNGSGWLGAALSGGAAPYTLSLQPRVAGLSSGTRRAWVLLESAPGNSSSVEVFLTVSDWLQHGSTGDFMRRPTATPLPDGKVLLVGQNDSGVAVSAVYDPAAPARVWGGPWTPSSRALGRLRSARNRHTPTAAAGGRVVAAGGYVPCCTGEAVGTWEIFEPATGTWRASLPLVDARFAHTATALADGRVLLAGGASGNEAWTPWGPPEPPFPALASAEILDPAAGTSAPTAPMSSPRRGASAVRLADGRVLVAGGRGADGAVLASAEVFDPVQGTWAPTGAMNQAREDAALVLLAGGRVLAAGGSDGASALASAELYDPVDETWTPTGSMATGRIAPAVRLPSGKVLAVAGRTEDLTAVTATLERYDPATGLWSDAGALPAHARGGPAVALLPTGTVLVAGDWTGGLSDVLLGRGETP